MQIVDDFANLEGSPKDRAHLIISPNRDRVEVFVPARFVREHPETTKVVRYINRLLDEEFGRKRDVPPVDEESS